MFDKKIVIKKRKVKKRCSFPACRKLVGKWDYLYQHGKLLCLPCASRPETQLGYVEGKETVTKVFRKKVKKKVVKAPAWSPKKKTKAKK